jgi:hypothetical protein
MIGRSSGIHWYMYVSGDSPDTDDNDTASNTRVAVMLPSAVAV